MKQALLKFFNRLSGGRQGAAPQPANYPPATIQAGSDNDVRRHLVQVLMRDMMRRHGIPAQWIDCQVVAVFSRTKGPGICIRLVLLHWDERLLMHASALQKELLADIQQFEPQAAQWLHGVTWQLEVDSSCPYSTLPDGSFWLESKAKVPPASRPVLEQHPKIATTQAEPVDRTELERLFAIRDRELSVQTDQGLVAAGYEKTQPAPL